jgi:hypothetical protein
VNAMVDHAMLPAIATSDLVRYDAMCHAIAECLSVDEVADLHDKALALELYAKQAMNVEAERKATEVRLRAERRAGELMAPLKRTPGQRTDITEPGPAIGRGEEQPTRSEYAETLDRTGIPRQTAHRWQQLASVPVEQFERHLKDPVVKPTTTGILKAANGAPRMDDGALWVWGRLRDFERDGHLARNPAEMFGGMTETMQADVRRVLPSLLDWLSELHEVVR